MSEYGKIVIGEPLDDNSDRPLLHTEVNSNNSTETYSALQQQQQQQQQATSAVYTTTYAIPPSVYPPPAPGYYGTYAPPPPPPPIVWFVESEPGEECALLGCLFSWFPPVGIITFCVHCNAPWHSRRGFWARTALIISLIVLIANILYWILVYSYPPGGDDFY
jgi:hypothetical protein